MMIAAAVTIRLCTKTDLSKLEWDGMFTAHREIIAGAFERQLAGSNVMLVAETKGAIVGQVWLDLQKAPEGGALLWALRVHPDYQRSGIGAELLHAAEAWLVAHRFGTAAIGVERWNVQARRLYEREGYRVLGPIIERYSYTTPAGVFTEVKLEEWLMEKTLLAVGPLQ